MQWQTAKKWNNFNLGGAGGVSTSSNSAVASACASAGVVPRGGGGLGGGQQAFQREQELDAAWSNFTEGLQPYEYEFLTQLRE